MKLHMAGSSPYVRKVRIVAAEVGLGDGYDIHQLAVSPIAPDDALVADNPLGKVPALLTDDGMALYDSRVICEYLDSLNDGATLFPAGGPARWQALRRQALADGILDAAVLTRYENAVRPGQFRWIEWIEGQMAKVHRALSALEHEADQLGDTVDIGTISIACALGYLDFRYADDDWRKSRPGLAAWYETFSKRPSMQATAPEG